VKLKLNPIHPLITNPTSYHATTAKDKQSFHSSWSVVQDQVGKRMLYHKSTDQFREGINKANHVHSVHSPTPTSHQLLSPMYVCESEHEPVTIQIRVPDCTFLWFQIVTPDTRSTISTSSGKELASIHRTKSYRDDYR
jgi:hypothetical protein